MDRIKIYFAGAIRGGREQATVYMDIIRHLQDTGHVFTEHIGDEARLQQEEREISDPEIHNRDISWLKDSDVMVAEVTVPSLGVGYEIARAIEMHKPVLCLFNVNTGRRLSAMIAGSDAIQLIRYSDFREVKIEIERFILEFRKGSGTLN